MIRKHLARMTLAFAKTGAALGILVGCLAWIKLRLANTAAAERNEALLFAIFYAAMYLALESLSDD
jgi:hypothetical protein